MLRRLIGMLGSGIATFRSATTTTSTSTTATINRPSDTQDGDLLIMVVAKPNRIPPTTLSGWSLLGSSNPFVGLFVYSKVAASEPASYTWTVGSSGAAMTCIAVRLCSGTDVLGSFTALTSTTILRGASITPTKGGLLLHIGIAYNLSGTRTLSPPSGFTQRAAIDLSTYLNLQVCSLTNNVKNATGIIEAISSVSASNTTGVLLQLANL